MDTHKCSSRSILASSLNIESQKATTFRYLRLHYRKDRKKANHLPGLKLFLPPFSHTSLLYLCFASHMALLGFYHDSSLFTSPVTSTHAGARDNRHCERDSVHGRGTQEDRSTINFGHVQIRTLADCVASECFIHCAMRYTALCPQANFYFLVAALALNLQTPPNLRTKRFYSIFQRKSSKVEIFFQLCDVIGQKLHFK